MITRVEPEWDAGSRSLALSLRAYEDALCSACGRPRSVCCDAGNDGRFAVLDPIRCHVTTALSMKREADSKRKVHAPDALLYEVELIGDRRGYRP